MGLNSPWSSKGCAITEMVRKSLPCPVPHFLNKVDQKHPPFIPKSILPVPSTFTPCTHPSHHTQTQSTRLTSTALSRSTTLRLKIPTDDENQRADSNRSSQITSGIPPHSTNWQLQGGSQVLPEGLVDGIPMGPSLRPQHQHQEGAVCCLCIAE